MVVVRHANPAKASRFVANDTQHLFLLFDDQISNRHADSLNQVGRRKFKLQATLTGTDINGVEITASQVDECWKIFFHANG